MLVKNPGFSAAAILALALGVGANSSIFSIINEAFLRPVPLAREPDRLVALGRASDARSFDGFTHPGYLEYRAQSRSFSGLMAYRGAEMNLASGGDPERVRATLVSHNYFSVLGVNAFYGRTFLPEEDQTPGSHPVVVVSHRLWKNRFGMDPNIVGRTLVINGQGFTVVGIAPEGFLGVELGEPADIWIPLMMEGTARPLFPVLNNRLFTSLHVVGRLKPGINLEQAQAEMTVLAHALEEVNRATKKQMTVVLSRNIRFTDPDDRAEAQTLLALLMTTAGVVLLTACANVANLLLARASVRRRETAMRLALGASRLQLVRQLLTESMLLALLGGALGIFVGMVLTRLPQAYLGSGIDFSPDIRVLTFTLLVSLLTGIIMGLTPALQGSKPDLVTALKGIESSGYCGARLRRLLVVLQVAPSLVLIVGAGLLVSTMRNLQAIDLGFDIHRLLVLPLNLRLQGYQEAKVRLMQSELVERLQALPGVQSVSLANDVPVRGMFPESREILPEGQELPFAAHRILVDYNEVTPRYFETLGVPMVLGRGFTDADKPDTPPVAVISETMARRYWPGADPIGKRFRIARFMSWSPYHQIVGVVKDTRYNRLEQRPASHLYLPLSQNFNVDEMVLLRTSIDPQGVRDALRREAAALDPNLPPLSVRTLAEVLAEQDSDQRMIAALVSCFGFLALTLASIGVYALMSYEVAQRTREIGVRMALGAKRWEVFRLVVGQAMFLAVAGVALGLVAAFFLARIIAGRLYGISSSDPLTLAGASVLLIAVAVLASYFPARRAMRIEPFAALRHE